MHEWNMKNRQFLFQNRLTIKVNLFRTTIAPRRLIQMKSTDWSQRILNPAMPCHVRLVWELACRSVQNYTFVEGVSNKSISVDMFNQIQYSLSYRKTSDDVIYYLWSWFDLCHVSIRLTTDFISFLSQLLCEAKICEIYDLLYFYGINLELSFRKKAELYKNLQLESETAKTLLN